MIVYYRIRNAKGAYWSCAAEGFRPLDNTVLWSSPFREVVSEWLGAARRIDPTARIVKVTVKRKAKWPVERAREWLAEHVPSYLAFADSEESFRFGLAVQSTTVMNMNAINRAVAEVLSGGET